MRLTPEDLERISKLETRLEVRRALRESEYCIVDPVLPNGALHVITGPPDIGKTTWTMQLLYDIDHGRSVFNGMPTRKVKWVYIALDRGMRDTDRTMRRLGFGDWDAPVYSIEEIIPKSNLKVLDQEPTIEMIIDHFPDVELFIIEGLQGLMPNTGRGQSQNKAEQLWMMSTRHTTLNRGITIIAVTHSPKSGEFNNDREAMLGSQALIGGAGTVIKFQLPPDENGQSKGMKGAFQTNDRMVTIMPKNSPHVYLRYSRGTNGSYELDARTFTPQDSCEQQTEVLVTPSDQLRVMDAHLLAFEGQAEVSMKQMKAWARDNGMSDARLNAWVKQQVESNRLLKEGAGKFRRSATIGHETRGVQ